MTDTTLFEKYAPTISANEMRVRDPRLAMESAGSNIQVYYAPFEHINPKAKIILVGITPGPTQMFNANNVARQALISGASYLDAIRIAKEQGAFSGEPMRSNLIKQLNHWGFHQWLGIKDASALFEVSGKDLVQTTSLLRYPVFVNDKDYAGTPDMTKNPVLRKYLLNHFVKEINSWPDALFIPLGTSVLKVLEKLAMEGHIDSGRIIRGLLHPSGNNTYRLNYLTGDQKGAVPHATNPEPYNVGRKIFKEKYLI